MSLKKLAIIVPIYNEEKNIERFLENWTNLKIEEPYDVILINDGSTDNTLKILNKKLKHKDIILINKKNEGHGMTILFGYKYAIKNQYNYIFQVDSDNQFSTQDFYHIWNLRSKDFDLICGCRHKRKDPFIRIFLTKIFLRLFIFITHFRKINDPNTPFRLINRSFLNKFLSKIKSDKCIAPNILMSIYAYKIINLNVSHFQNNDTNSEWSKIKLFKFCINLFLEIIYFRLKK